VYGTLGLPAKDIPKLSESSFTSTASKTEKRKADPQESEDVTMQDASKRSKGTTLPSVESETDRAQANAKAAAAYIPFLTADNLLPPKLPSREELEKVLLDLRKKALVEEYFGNDADGS
jgi:pre-mRNA-splicing factor ISY1